jgi:hypothetical protein
MGKKRREDRASTEATLMHTAIGRQAKHDRATHAGLEAFNVDASAFELEHNRDAEV